MQTIRSENIWLYLNLGFFLCIKNRNLNSVGNTRFRRRIPQMEQGRMFLPIQEIFNNFCGLTRDVKNISEKFPELKTDEDRFKQSHEICRDFILYLNFNRINKSYQKFLYLKKVGDSHFYKNQFWQALRFYNESIAFAPAGSEHLAVAFFQRSLVLSKLSFPEEAVSDISRALPLVITDRLKANIVKHKEYLLKFGKNLKNNCLIGTGEVSPIEGGRSPFFDSASRSVGLEFSSHYGRQLITNKDIKTGEILIVEKPYSSVLLPNYLYTHCSNCFKRGLNLKPCDGCSFAMFCSEDCLRISQENYHGIECRILDILVNLKLGPIELLSLRILIIASLQGKNLQKLHEEVKKCGEMKNNNNENCYKSSDFINIYNLVTNTEKRTGSDLFYRSFIAEILIYVLESCSNFFSSLEKEEEKSSLKGFCGGLILHLMQSMPCNAHEISEFCEDGSEEIGAGAYATLSLINHSCDPNVVRFSCGDLIVLRAIKPIKQGEQILDNYGYHYATHSLSERQAALMKQYYFKCECEACTQLWPMYEHLPSENLQLKKPLDMNIYKNKTDKFEENLIKIFNGNFDSAMIEENMKYLDFLDEFVIRPWQNFNKCQEAIKHCLGFSKNHFRFSKGVFG